MTRQSKPDTPELSPSAAPGLANDAADELLADLASTAHTSMCETLNGVRLHPHDVLRAALAGHIRRTVVDSDHVVIDLGRRQRLFTGSARHAAKLLIKRCEHIGCETPTNWCDIDHIDEWDRDHGTTSQHNATVLCRTHNNHHRWRTTRASNGSSYTIDPNGTVIMPVGARPPPTSTAPRSNPGTAPPVVSPTPDERARV